jgi:hypothetical protein
MKRSIWLLIVALFAVAAIEFGVLGAASAGASFVPGWLGGPGDASAVRDGNPACPPHSDRCRPTPAPTPISPPVSPPPCQPDREHSAARACDGQPASIQLTPDPLVIHCDGLDHSTLTVRVTDAKGQPIADGTNVYFMAYNGNTTPWSAQTHRGVASTTVSFYGDIFPPGPNVGVDVGPLEAGVRIRCFPDSNRQPPSPPPCAPSPPSVSPPCATPTPPPCSVSPPSVSPPCATPTPPPTATPGIPSCVLSLPPVSPPCPAPTSAPSVGGQISFGTPALVNGSITVPVLTSAAQDPYLAFNVHVTFNGSLLSATSAQAGDALQGLGSGIFCVPLMVMDGGSGALVPCTVLGGGPGTTTAGTLTTLTFTLRAATGCSHLHLFTFGPPDNGDVSSGTFTMTSSTALQQNTYGSDITVDLVTGATGCTPSPSPTPVATATSTPTKVVG